MTPDIDINELIDAFGRTTLRNLRMESSLHELQLIIDALRVDVHHRDIQIQALNDRIDHLIEKSETRIMPVILDPILEVEEFDLRDAISPKRDDGPLIL